MTTTPHFSTTTILNDGQFRYPVDSSELAAWEALHGPISASNYEQFCLDVDCSLVGVLPGSPEMIDVCEALVDSGAAYRRLS